MAANRLLPSDFRSLPMLIAGLGGIGRIPYAAGTWASLATLPVGWLIATYSGWLGLLVASACVFAIGLWAAEIAVRRLGREDPGFIVVDEMAGQLLTLAAAPVSIEAFAAAFLAFRVFDILKPWPANWADDRLTGGFGAMADDMVAGAYGAAALLAASAVGAW